MSSSPPKGGRRARLAAERSGRVDESPVTGSALLTPHAEPRSPYAEGQSPYETSSDLFSPPATNSFFLPQAPDSYLPAPETEPGPDPEPRAEPDLEPAPRLERPRRTGRRSASRVKQTDPAAPSAAGGAATAALSTTELEIIRGRRAARPQTARRRVELALGRSISNRRLWGSALAVGLVLLVPGASMLQRSVTIADSGLSGGASNLSALQLFPDSNRQAQPNATGDKTNDMAKTTASALAAVAAQAAAAADTKTKKAPTTKQPSSGSTGRLNDAESGLPWPSGVYARGQGVAGVKAFGEWRGAAVDVVLDWQERQTWDDIVNSNWLYNTWKNTPYTKVFGVAPIPEGDSSATMAGCAAGSYNDKWRQFAANIKAAGLDDESVIRLGWEFNGDWYKWSANDPAQFAECWRQIVSSAESVAPALLWDWNVNRGKGASVEDARKAYPGDNYVDIVGVDSYDQWPGATNEASWAEQYSGPYGLKFWSDFARDHGKKLSVPEWAVYPGPASSGQNGGDNAFYIAKMHAFFKSEGSHLAYESYFNESASYIASALFSPTQNPNAAAKYNSLFGH